MSKRVFNKTLFVLVVLVLALGGLSSISRSYHELDQSLHTRNMELVGYIGDMNLQLAPNGIITQIQKVGDYAYTSYIYSWTHGQRTGGLFIIDVSDPAAPKIASHLPFADSRTQDVKVNPEGTLAVLAGESIGKDQIEQSFLGITIVDISDKLNPKLLSRLSNTDPVSGERHGVHDVFIHGNYVYYTAGDRGVAIVDISIPSDPIEVAVMPNPVIADVEDEEKLDIFPHDMYVQTDPSGRVFAYIANWDGGVQIWDVTVPAYPLRVGSWSELGAPFQNTHYVRPSPSGKITVVGPEMPSGFSGFLSILHTSDVQNPKLLSTWAAPGHHWQHSGFSMTQHNFDVTEDRIYLANYSQGVWVLDISNPANPKILASFGPESYMQPPNPDARKEFEADLEKAKTDPLMPRYPWVGTWSVEEVDGLLYVSDMSTGIYILRLTGDAATEVSQEASHSTPGHPELTAGTPQNNGLTFREQIELFESFEHRLIIFNNKTKDQRKITKE